MILLGCKRTTTIGTHFVHTRRLGARPLLALIEQNTSPKGIPTEPLRRVSFGEGGRIPTSPPGGLD